MAPLRDAGYVVELIGIDVDPGSAHRVDGQLLDRRIFSQLPFDRLDVRSQSSIDKDLRVMCGAHAPGCQPTKHHKGPLSCPPFTVDHKKGPHTPYSPRTQFNAVRTSVRSEGSNPLLEPCGLLGFVRSSSTRP